MPYARKVRGRIWELRPGDHRLFYAQAGHTFIILHAYRKKTDKAPEREIATAERRLAEVEGEPR